MTSKLIEALNKCETRKSYEGVTLTLIDDELRAYIEESLERLEVLEKENKQLLVNKNVAQALAIKYKKAIELACKILSWDCPCCQDLIDDLDCENRCQPDIDYGECWEKFFLKEVINNEI